MRKLFALTLSFAACSLSLPTFAQWQLHNDSSQLNFVSIKKDMIAEVHSFKDLSGEISKDGSIEFAIDLASVETNIGIRNDRMRQFLFETQTYPKASFASKIDIKQLSSLTAGEAKIIETSGVINLHGKEQATTLSVMVTKKADGDIYVNSLKPVIINASAFDLVTGVKKLTSLAKLPNISVAVPVTFQLTFKKQ